MNHDTITTSIRAASFVDSPRLHGSESEEHQITTQSRHSPAGFVMPIHSPFNCKRQDLFVPHTPEDLSKSEAPSRRRSE
jgi:hypothetical protein